jgi:hypothetical protein
MKSNIFLLFIVAFLNFNSFSQSGISILKVRESYTTTELKYVGEATLHFQLENGLEVTITPINPADLDSEFITKDLSSGQLIYKDYQYNQNNYFIKKQKRNKKQSKTNTEMLIELADSLLFSGMITQSSYENALLEIEQRNNKNEQIKSAESTYNFNPYKVNGKYLGVYNINFVNKSDKPILFDQNICITQNQNLHERYSIESLKMFYEEAHESNYHKIARLINETLQDSLIIPPKSQINKYFCIDPLLPVKSEINCFLLDKNRAIKKTWNLDIITNNIQTVTDYNVFDLETRTNSGLNLAEIDDTDGFTTIDNDVDAYLVDNKLYVNSSNLSIPIQILSLYTYVDYVYFSVSFITPSQYINSEKLKANDIIIEMEKHDNIIRK